MTTVVKIGTEFQVNSQTAGSQWYPSITGLTNGGFVVTWQDGLAGSTSGSSTLGDASGSAVHAQLYAADGSKVGGEFLVNTADQRLAGLPGRDRPQQRRLRRLLAGPELHERRHQGPDLRRERRPGRRRIPDQLRHRQQPEYAGHHRPAQWRLRRRLDQPGQRRARHQGPGL